MKKVINNLLPNINKQNDWLENQEFYDLMQAYRIMPITEQELVVRAFEKVKQLIRFELDKQKKELLEEIESMKKNEPHSHPFEKGDYCGFCESVDIILSKLK